jgi:hypothetical protein
MPARYHPGTSDRHHPGIVIAINPEPVIGMPRNTDRHRPESPAVFLEKSKSST